MRPFNVTITARVTKTYRVYAKDEDQANDLAHDAFSILQDSASEYYEQDTLDIEEIKE